MLLSGTPIGSTIFLGFEGEYFVTVLPIGRAIDTALIL